MAGLDHSITAKADTPQTISAAVPTSMSLECSIKGRQARLVRRSAITAKPMPPTMKSAGTTTFTTGSSA